MTIVGCNSRTACATAASESAVATTRISSAPPIRLRKPSMATGSVSQIATVFTVAPLRTSADVWFCFSGAVSSGLELSNYHGAQRVFSEIEPAILQRVLDEHRAFRAKRAGARIFRPAAAGQLGQFA